MPIPFSLLNRTSTGNSLLFPLLTVDLNSTFLKYPTSFINYQHAICHHSMYASKPPQVHTHVLLKALTMTSTISFFLVLAVKQSYSVGTMIAKKLSLRLPCAYSCPKTLSASNSFLIPTDLTVILSFQVN
uniref:Uncharacterized protein n=1 Tax=Zea mays TaxID=4577 RepID=C0HIZ2_MAIZE|nr:unknown [Zea mays]